MGKQAGIWEGLWMNQKDYVLTEEPYSKILDFYNCNLAIFLCLAV